MVLPGDELCEVGAECNLGGHGEVQQRDGVEYVCQPLALLLPVHVQSPDGVLQRLAAHGDLGGQWLLVEELEGTSEYEVLGELVVPVQSEEGLALHGVGVVALHVCFNLLSGVDEALVEDGDHAHGVVHAVVHVLCERDSSGGDDDASWSDLCGSEDDFCAVGSFVSSGELELVLLGNLLGHGLGGVVECVEAVLVGDGVVAYPLPEVVAEGFCHGEDDASLADGVALDVVELSVGVGAVVVVQAVEVHGAQQGCGFELCLREVGLIDACGVVLVLDVEAELLSLCAGGA